MVGTWVRVMGEFEGFAEEDTSGSCTIVIAGNDQNSLTISYTDGDAPEYNFRNKAMTICQGELYWGCGNSLWLAEVDHEGPWGITHAVTLLEDGRLLLQNYWEMDGAPSVSYEWFEKVN
jgi:hypothetical protein